MHNTARPLDGSAERPSGCSPAVFRFVVQTALAVSKKFETKGANDHELQLRVGMQEVPGEMGQAVPRVRCGRYEQDSHPGTVGLRLAAAEK